MRKTTVSPQGTRPSAPRGRRQAGEAGCAKPRFCHGFANEASRRIFPRRWPHRKDVSTPLRCAQHDTSKMLRLRCAQKTYGDTKQTQKRKHPVFPRKNGVLLTGFCSQLRMMMTTVACSTPDYHAAGRPASKLCLLYRLKCRLHRWVPPISCIMYTTILKKCQAKFQRKRQFYNTARKTNCRKRSETLPGFSGCAAPV